MEKVAHSKGSKKTSIARARIVESKSFNLKIDHMKLDIHPDRLLVSKMKQIINIIGFSKLENLEIDIQTKGGGPISKVYAIVQAFSRAIVAFYGKFYDEQIKNDIKNRLIEFDRSLLVSDPRRSEPKKFGGPAARARYTKSYR